jgi:hypothetical protein
MLDRFGVGLLPHRGDARAVSDRDPAAGVSPPFAAGNAILSGSPKSTTMLRHRAPDFLFGQPNCRSGEIDPELFGISFAVDSLVATRYRGNDGYVEERDVGRGSFLDHAAVGVRLVPRVHCRVPLVAAERGERGREEPVLLLADVLVQFGHRGPDAARYRDPGARRTAHRQFDAVDLARPGRITSQRPVRQHLSRRYRRPLNPLAARSTGFGLAQL